jgi:hypothetical protein
MTKLLLVYSFCWERVQKQNTEYAFKTKLNNNYAIGHEWSHKQVHPG